MQNDAREVHVKVVQTPLGPHFCTVLPRGPEPNTPTFPQVLGRRKASEDDYHYNGPSLLQDYAQTRADQG